MYMLLGKFIEIYDGVTEGGKTTKMKELHDQKEEYDVLMLPGYITVLALSENTCFEKDIKMQTLPWKSIVVFAEIQWAVLSKWKGISRLLYYMLKNADSMNTIEKGEIFKFFANLV